MNIDVIISGWEQECCGKAFAVGERTAWSLHEFDPDSLAVDAPRTFSEEHHGQTPDDVPHWEVSGVVSGITGVSYRTKKIPGSHALTRDTDTPRFTTLEAVRPRGEGLDVSEYRVNVEIDDDAVLPGYVTSSEERRRLEKEEREALLARARSDDVVGLSLRQLADDAAQRFGAGAEINQSSDGFALSITPARDDAVSIVITRSRSEESDGIAVQLGEGRWQLEATPDGVDSARQLLDAAAAGRVVDTPVPPEFAQRIDTVATGENGRIWASSRPLRALVLGNGVTAMGGRARELLDRGEHRYSSWV